MSLSNLTIDGWERDRFHRATADAISALPETVEPEHVAPAKTEYGALLEREYAGLRVEIGYHPKLGVTLFVQEGGPDAPGRLVEIDPAKALDAFNHPYCYLPA